jgi:hypothetical protein
MNWQARLADQSKMTGPGRLLMTNPEFLAGTSSVCSPGAASHFGRENVTELSFDDRRRPADTHCVRRWYRLKVEEAVRMSQTSQLMTFFYAIGYLILALFVCVAFYKYLAAAVEMRSLFHTRVRMVAPLAVLSIGPRMALRQFDLPTSIAAGLDAVSMLAMLVIMVIGLRVLIGLFSQFFTSTARNP